MSTPKRPAENAPIFVFLLLGFCFFLSSIPPLEAAEAVGNFTYVEGKVDILRGSQLPAASAKVGESVFVKDVIRTKSDSKAEITFVDRNILRIGQRSRIDISEYVSVEGKGNTIIKLPRGKVEAIIPPGEAVKRIAVSPEGNRFEIHTPNAVAGVRGTDFFIWYEWNLTQILVTEGTVCGYNLASKEGVVCIPAGLYSSIFLNAPPTPPRPATLMDQKRYEQGETKIEFIPPPTPRPPTLTTTGILGEPTFSIPVPIPVTVPITESIPALLPPPPHVRPPR